MIIASELNAFHLETSRLQGSAYECTMKAIRFLQFSTGIPLECGRNLKNVNVDGFLRTDFHAAETV
jgi:hypothetical protein